MIEKNGLTYNYKHQVVNTCYGLLALKNGTVLTPDLSFYYKELSTTLQPLQVK